MLRRALVACLLVAAAFFVRCGSTPPPPTVPTPLPTLAPTPTPAPTLAPLMCSPTPPPLYGIKVNVHIDQGYRKTLDSKPLVVNVDHYCQRVGLSGHFCFTRAEDDPQRADCDRMAMGVAADTGRYGPTWRYNGQPCAGGGDQPGCNNHPENQFLVIAKGAGEFAACAAKDVPIEGDRCGVCNVIVESGHCQ
jgi:uncharacterized Zn-binding protein involved in type VI secretion